VFEELRTRARGQMRHRRLTWKGTWSWRRDFECDLPGRHGWKCSSDNGSSTERHSLHVTLQQMSAQHGQRRGWIGEVAVVKVTVAGVQMYERNTRPPLLRVTG
jgi:hypothetical protein